MSTSTITARDRIRWVRESATAIAHHLRGALEGNIDDVSPCVLAELREALRQPGPATALRDFLVEYHAEEWGHVAEDLEDLFVKEVAHVLRRD